MIENRFFILVHHTAHTGGGETRKKQKLLREAGEFYFIKFIKNTP